MLSKDKKWNILSVLSAILAGYFLQNYSDLKRHLVLESGALNNTQYANQSFLIFNRVPKAGSETLWGLLDILSKQNGFISYSDSAEVKQQRGAENTFLNREQRKSYVEMLRDDNGETNITHNSPYCYIKHINFLNFEEFNYTNPIYVNMVRHPIERLISWYYYTRQGWYQLKWNSAKNETELKSKLNPTMMKRTYEECVMEQEDECIYPVGGKIHMGRYGGSHYSQISFYCGMEPECDEFGSREGLNIAKANVEKYFAVVGVLEEWQKSLIVMENYVPYFFKNASQTYLKQMKGKHKNSNNIKPQIPKYIKDKVTMNFTVEMEFYEFCKARLYRQYLTTL